MSNRDNDDVARDSEALSGGEAPKPHDERQSAARRQNLPPAASPTARPPARQPGPARPVAPGNAMPSPPRPAPPAAPRPVQPGPQRSATPPAGPSPASAARPQAAAPAKPAARPAAPGGAPPAVPAKATPSPAGGSNRPASPPARPPSVTTPSRTTAPARPAAPASASPARPAQAARQSIPVNAPPVDDDDAVIVPAPDVSVFLHKPDYAPRPPRKIPSFGHSLETRRTFIPILFTGGLIMIAIAALHFLGGEGNPFVSLPLWLACVLVAFALLLWGITVTNMLVVKQLLVSGMKK